MTQTVLLSGLWCSHQTDWTTDVYMGGKYVTRCCSIRQEIDHYCSSTVTGPSIITSFIKYIPFSLFFDISYLFSFWPFLNASDREICWYTFSLNCSLSFFFTTQRVGKSTVGYCGKLNLELIIIKLSCNNSTLVFFFF